MASYWWYRGVGGNANWDSQSSPPNYDNWWLNAGHTTPATTLPGDNDSMTFDGTVAPATGPGSTIKPLYINTTNLDADIVGSTVTSNIWCNNNGTIRWGRPERRHDWYGQLQPGVDGKFWGNSSTDIGGYLLDPVGLEFFCELNLRSISVGTEARFHDKVQITGGRIGVPAFFLGNHRWISTYWSGGFTSVGGPDPTVYVYGELEIEKGAAAFDLTDNVAIKLMTRSAELKFTGSLDFAIGDRPTVEYSLHELAA